MFVCKLLSGQDPLSPGRPCGGEGKGRGDKEAALLGEAGNCAENFGGAGRVSLLPASRGAGRGSSSSGMRCSA